MSAKQRLNANPRQRRLLIVDDDVDFADSLLDLLEPLGYVVRFADRAETAHALLKMFDAQVALFDIRLGLASGVDLFATLKSERPDLIGVIMTGHVDSKTVIEALRLGAYDYVDKACHPSEFHAVLDRCFEKLQLQEEREAAYEALRIAKDAAERANQAKSDFLATVSHELRTPLNAIIGFSDLIITQGVASLGQQQILGYIQDINASGTHLLAIINDILDLSKAEAGRLEINEDLVDIAEAVASAIRMVRGAADRNGVRLAIELADNLPYLFADERKLKQILVNLLSNAIKFTPAGGEVALAATVYAETLKITIRDTGIGIAEEDIPRAFEAFGQIDNKLSRKYDGTGLGLPLAHAMMREHGGTLSLASRLGEGTIVTITFSRERLRPLLAATA